MNAGRLDEQITIEEYTPGEDDWGGVNKGGSWSAITGGTDVWAEVADVAGKENYEASQLVEKADKRMRIRYLSTVGAAMRVLYDSVYYSIYSVRRIGTRDDGLELMVKKREGSWVP